MSYVDGFIAAVPANNRDVYAEHARVAAEVFKEFGALRVVECWGDDVPQGETTSFPLAVQCQSDEVVVFSWIWWPSRAARDEGIELAMKDPRLDPQNNPMPFDGKRLVFGGFDVLVDV